eukprot:CAMPEP_0114500564 /NCGR_PEP_ID=MMETSP0109-20121206/8031_1 /TAXON_ID=29199 /ORGANISM="Chlorarachnion reptans, Strain CCCM449" /LENGTH=522 /DNA_ID=CAMNT_0001678233 /DNA_START=253 /DNA_END=1821 /DNA_ORIENTATION=+
MIIESGGRRAPLTMLRGQANAGMRYRLTPESVDKMAKEVDDILALYEISPAVRTFGNAAAENWRDSLLDTRTPSVVEELRAVRDRGEEALRDLRMPFKKNEAYRYMSLRRIYNNKFAKNSGEVDPVMVAESEQSEMEGYRVVVVDGKYDASLSSLGKLPSGVYFGGLQGLPEEYKARVFAELEIVPEDIYGSRYWAELNKASLSDAMVVIVPEGVKIEQPVQITFYTTGSDTPGKASSSFPRLVVLSDKDSEGTIYVDHTGDRDANYYSAPVTTVKVDDGAEFNFYYHQHQSEAACHTEVVNATVMNGAKFNWRGILNGGLVGRLNMDVDLKGNDAEAEVMGATLATEGLQSDIHTYILHHGERGTSRQEHRSIVGHKGEGTFRGQIKILKPAIDCDADQQSRALLLSSTGIVNSMPTLVVEPDQVAGAAHGSTVSDLQGEEMFYMLTRGISEDDAKVMLTKGFIRHIIGEFPFEKMRVGLMEKITSIAQSATVHWRYTDLDGSAAEFDRVMGRDEDMAMFG